MIIRLTVEIDVPLFARIERSAATLFLDTDRAWVAGEEPTDHEHHDRAIAEGLRWVAVAGSEPVGFLLGQLVDASLYVAELAVASAHQRRGAARLLMATAETHAREIGAVTISLATYRDLPWNAPFYRRLGFDEPCVLPPYLAEQLHAQAKRGYDAALRCGMVKRLA